MTDVVIPVKDLSQAKGRLRGVLNPEARASLVLAMLQDLLTTLQNCDLGHIWLVARDQEVLDLGRRFGARLVPEAMSQGYNEAVCKGLECVDRDMSVIVLPADLPSAQPADINRLISSCVANDPTVGIVPDRYNRGTNGLYFSVPDLFVPSFGAGSFLRHNLAASRAGITATVVPLENLALDIDTGDDLMTFARSAQPGATRDYLQAISFGNGPFKQRTGSFQ